MKPAVAAAVCAVLASACVLSTPAPTGRHVFLIVMENHTPEQALSGPFLASLRDNYRSAENYYAITHPSLPNYIAMTSGQTWGIADDSYHELPAGKDLGSQLTAAGVSWKAYMEGYDPAAGCLDSPLPYDPGHNPFAFYGGRCPPNVVPLTTLQADLAKDTPRFSWITPDRCHDTHDCEVSVGDGWLRQQVGEIMGSNAWKDNGILFITYDEDDYNVDNRVVMLVVAPGMSPRKSTKFYNHYSLLASLEDLLGVGRLGEAAKAQPMTDLINR